MIGTKIGALITASVVPFTLPSSMIAAAKAAPFGPYDFAAVTDVAPPPHRNRPGFSYGTAIRVPPSGPAGGQSNLISAVWASYGTLTSSTATSRAGESPWPFSTRGWPLCPG